MNLFSSLKHPDWLMWPTRFHIQLVTWTLPLEVKWSHHEAHHSSASQAKVKNAWSDISTPPFVLIAYTRPVLLSLSHIYKMCSLQFCVRQWPYTHLFHTNASPQILTTKLRHNAHNSDINAPHSWTIHRTRNYCKQIL